MSKKRFTSWYPSKRKFFFVFSFNWKKLASFRDIQSDTRTNEEKKNCLCIHPLFYILHTFTIHFLHKSKSSLWKKIARGKPKAGYFFCWFLWIWVIYCYNAPLIHTMHNILINIHNIFFTIYGNTTRKPIKIRNTMLLLNRNLKIDQKVNGERSERG